MSYSRVQWVLSSKMHFKLTKVLVKGEKSQNSDLHWTFTIIKSGGFPIRFYIR